MFSLSIFRCSGWRQKRVRNRRWQSWVSTDSIRGGVHDLRTNFRVPWRQVLETRHHVIWSGTMEYDHLVRIIRTRKLLLFMSNCTLTMLIKYTYQHDKSFSRWFWTVKWFHHQHTGNIVILITSFSIYRTLHFSHFSVVWWASGRLRILRLHQPSSVTCSSAIFGQRCWLSSTSLYLLEGNIYSHNHNPQ